VAGVVESIVDGKSRVVAAELWKFGDA